MMGDEPPYLTVGTEVSAKYKGAFCEAKVKKVDRCVKCKITFKNVALGSALVTDDNVKGNLRIGSTVEARTNDRQTYSEAIITKINDTSQYTVVFDDGDETTLRRTSLCLKSGRHFAASETLDQLPLTNPEHFGTPVITKSKKRRSLMRNTNDDSSDDDMPGKGSREVLQPEPDMGKVISVDFSDRRQREKENWFPALICSPVAQESVKIDQDDDYLVRSFKDGRFYTVPKKESRDFRKDSLNKVENSALRSSIEKAILYLDKGELPSQWERDLLFATMDFDSDNSDNDDSDMAEPDDVQSEEKDRFVAQLYKFMDDRGTPINNDQQISGKDVDLYRLFMIVHKHGSYNRVTNQNLWKNLTTKLGFSASLNAPNINTISNQVKQAYRKYLHGFEDFYKKLGCTMISETRTERARHRSGRSFALLNREPDAKPGIKAKKDADRKELDEGAGTSTSDVTKSVAVEEPKIKETPDIKKESKRTTKKITKDLADEQEKVKSVPSKVVDKSKAKEVASKSPKKEKPVTIPALEKHSVKRRLVADDTKSLLSPKAEKQPVVAKLAEQEDKIKKTVESSPSKSRDRKRTQPEEVKKLVEESNDDKGSVKDTDKGDDSSSVGGLGNDVSFFANQPTFLDIRVNDKVKVKYGKGKQQKAYEAKVMDIKDDKGEWSYFVHYTGWNTRYDEWIKKYRLVSNLSRRNAGRRGRSASVVKTDKDDGRHSRSAVTNSGSDASSPTKERDSSPADSKQQSDTASASSVQRITRSERRTTSSSPLVSSRKAANRPSKEDKLKKSVSESDSDNEESANEEEGKGQLKGKPGRRKLLCKRRVSNQSNSDNDSDSINSASPMAKKVLQKKPVRGRTSSDESHSNGSSPNDSEDDNNSALTRQTRSKLTDLILVADSDGKAKPVEKSIAIAKKKTNRSKKGVNTESDTSDLDSKLQQKIAPILETLSKAELLSVEVQAPVIAVKSSPILLQTTRQVAQSSGKYLATAKEAKPVQEQPVKTKPIEDDTEKPELKPNFKLMKDVQISKPLPTVIKPLVKLISDEGKTPTAIGSKRGRPLGSVRKALEPKEPKFKSKKLKITPDGEEKDDKSPLLVATSPERNRKDSCEDLSPPKLHQMSIKKLEIDAGSFGSTPEKPPQITPEKPVQPTASVSKVVKSIDFKPVAPDNSFQQTFKTFASPSKSDDFFKDKIKPVTAPVETIDKEINLDSEAGSPGKERKKLSKKSKKFIDEDDQYNSLSDVEGKRLAEMGIFRATKMAPVVKRKYVRKKKDDSNLSVSKSASELDKPGMHLEALLLATEMADNDSPISTPCSPRRKRKPTPSSEKKKIKKKLSSKMYLSSDESTNDDTDDSKPKKVLVEKKKMTALAMAKADSIYAFSDSPSPPLCGTTVKNQRDKKQIPAGKKAASCIENSELANYLMCTENVPASPPSFPTSISGSSPVVSSDSVAASPFASGFGSSSISSMDFTPNRKVIGSVSGSILVKSPIYASASTYTPLALSGSQHPTDSGSTATPSREFSGPAKTTPEHRPLLSGVSSKYNFTESTNSPCSSSNRSMRDQSLSPNDRDNEEEGSSIGAKTSSNASSAGDADTESCSGKDRKPDEALLRHSSITASGAHCDAAAVLGSLSFHHVERYQKTAVSLPKPSMVSPSFYTESRTMQQTPPDTSASSKKRKKPAASSSPKDGGLESSSFYGAFQSSARVKGIAGKENDLQLNKPEVSTRSDAPFASVSGTSHYQMRPSTSSAERIVADRPTTSHPAPSTYTPAIPRPNRPPKYNFLVNLEEYSEGPERIAILQEKISDLRKTYMSLKAEVNTIDRRRKKLRRRQKEAAEKAAGSPELQCS